MPTSTVEGYAASEQTAGRVAAVLRARLAPGRLHRAMQGPGLQAVHFPLTTEVPRFDNLPTVVTVHDLQHLVMPEFFSRAERAYRRLVYAPSIGRAAAIIAISEYVKETIVELLGIPGERIQVSHFGIDHETFCPDADSRDPQVRPPFVLYPANRWPHKNHARLEEALSELRASRPELRLVLTGSGHESARVAEGVEILGRVSQDELVRLYHSAEAVVFPSLYEGFGQPPLEAMACGCPVACSNAAALPEVCGDAARYFDPSDPSAIATALDDVLEHRTEYRDRGLRRARAFTWTEAARSHERVYRSVLDG